jgi:hypothetical protein
MYSNWYFSQLCKDSAVVHNACILNRSHIDKMHYLMHEKAEGKHQCANWVSLRK